MDAYDWHIYEALCSVIKDVNEVNQSRSLSSTNNFLINYIPIEKKYGH